MLFILYCYFIRVKKIASHYCYFNSLERNKLFRIDSFGRLIGIEDFEPATEIQGVVFLGGILFPSIPLWHVAVQSGYDYALVGSVEKMYLHYCKLGKNSKIQIGNSAFQIEPVADQRCLRADFMYQKVVLANNKKQYLILTEGCDETMLGKDNFLDGVLFSTGNQIIKTWLHMQALGLTLSQIFKLSVDPITEIVGIDFYKTAPIRLSLLENMNLREMQISRTTRIKDLYI